MTIQRLRCKSEIPQGENGPPIGAVYRAWSSYARQLTGWVFRRLVNRTDVWGRYWLDEDGQVQRVTRPKEERRGKCCLGASYVEGHFLADHTPGHTRLILGLHTTSRLNTSKCGCIDIDRHGDDDPVSPQQNLTAALAWYWRGVDLGFRPLLTCSNGRGGFHLRFLFTDMPKTPLVYAFLRWIVRDYKDYGLPKEPETFPRQAQLDAQTPLGNWIRVPGRHHSRPYWCEVFDGSHWLTVKPAVEYLLSLPGDNPSLIPDEVRNAPPPQPRPAPMPRPPMPRPTDLTERRVIAAARSYLAKIPPAIETRGGDNRTYHAACLLVEKFALSVEQAWPLICEWNEQCDPPWDHERLHRKLVQADERATNRGAFLRRLEGGAL